MGLRRKMKNKNYSETFADQQRNLLETLRHEG